MLLSCFCASLFPSFHGRIQHESAHHICARCDLDHGKMEREMQGSRSVESLAKQNLQTMETGIHRDSDWGP